MTNSFNHSEMQQALNQMLLLQNDILTKMQTSTTWMAELPVWIDQYNHAAQQLRNLLDVYTHDEHREDYAKLVQFLIEQQEHILIILQKERDALAAHMKQLEQGKKAIQGYSSGNLTEKQVFLSMDT